ncbi:hypothetical protein J2Z40_002508 [Cytobacillus eiseniae]|uniref:DUF4367 domain-containing protein n=1 Tax=Cytobacillus eiseniae TaxID=762947 RepID=A0ABS4RHU7_9BACI|nr:hypothetical protein [Cytobacillus eiseniae]MBP2241935.1 hypothetical protein [Cytobacillus eiseniae]
MSKHDDDQWKQLQQVKSTSQEKEQIRQRVWQSMQSEIINKKPERFFHWQGIATACLIILICGSFLGFIFQNTGEQNAEHPTIDYRQFSWEIENIYTEQAEDSLEIYKEKQDMPVGTIKEVSGEEMESITTQSPMFVEKELENFPYPITMYIEHVKMMDTALRYHFFIPNDEKWIYFTFDYPKLEYAEIFHAMSTIKFNDKKPYIHNHQLYVNHGYGTMLFPTGLTPYSITLYKEIYHGLAYSNKAYSSYIEAIEATGLWKKVASNGGRHTFISLDGNQEVSITWHGNEIIYELGYPNREE